MSLTSFLALPEVKARFKQDWPIPSPPPSTKNWSIPAPPVSARPAIIGTAFDYVFRFYLRRLNSIAQEREHWIADNALARMRGSMREIGRSICDTAHIRHQDFLNGKPLDDDLLSSAILLAQLDGVFRSGGMLPSSGEFTVLPEDLTDLRQLVAACDWKQWRVLQFCQLNPTFGWASALVGGADADFHLDTTLYELKTVRQVTGLTGHYHQLVAYSALNFLNSGPPITELGIYFSRFAEIVRWAAPDWKDTQYESFLLWFCTNAEKRFDGSGIMLSNLMERVPSDLNLRPQIEALVVEIQTKNN